MNDQSDALVDTALVRSRELPVEEIAGGCFCCRFISLVEAADRLERDARHVNASVGDGTAIG